MDRCVNCGIATSRCNTLRGRTLDDETTLSVFRQWLIPRPVNSSDSVCQACWDIAQKPLTNGRRRLGHRSVCLRCGLSLKSRVSHLLHTGSPRELRVYNVIQEWIVPRTVEVASHICHKCWVAADRAAIQMISGPSTFSQIYIPEEMQPQAHAAAQMISGQSTSSQENIPDEVKPQVPDLDIEIKLEALDLPVVPPDEPAEPPNQEVRHNQPEPTIVLPEYMRAIETQSRCFIEGCQRPERYRVPLSTRKMLLNQHKYYVPVNNRLCNRHLVFEAWDFLGSLKNNYVQTFTAKHIQDMMSLVTQKSN